MNDLIKEPKFDDGKRNIIVGLIFTGVIGLLWAALYWRDDISFSLGVILIHLLMGFVFSLGAMALAKILRIEMNLTGLLGLLVAVFWVSPTLLSNIQSHHYITLDASLEGLSKAGLVFFLISLFGFFGGYFFGRVGPLVGLFFVTGFALIVPICFALMFPATSNSDTTIVNRLDEERNKTEPQTRVMVLGIDGGTWDVIIPLLKQGRLPNLKALMENGQYGILNSFSGETRSPVVWTSIFTGKLPENHGLTGWKSADSRNRFSKSLWNILNEYGQKTITVNIPGTFPPEQVLGVQVSGFPIPSSVDAGNTKIRTNNYGCIYGSPSLGLEVTPTKKVEVAPEEAWSSATASYSPLYKSSIPLTECVMSVKYGSYSPFLQNLYIEFLDNRRIFKTSRQQVVLPVLIGDETNDGTANYDTVYVFPKKADSNPLTVLKEGQWSDWVPLEINGVEMKYKLKLLSTSIDRFEIYVSPLFQSSLNPRIPFTYPPDFSSELSQETGQYVVEGAGWLMYRDEITLDLLYEHLKHVANQRVKVSEYLLGTVPDWKMFIHIFTTPDRVKHAYWKYHQPEPYQFVDKNLVEQHGDKVNSIIETVDSYIGSLLPYTGEDTTIVVLSDHGFQANLIKERGPHGSGYHHQEGIYIFSGNGIKKQYGNLSLDTESFPKASILDVTPTLLYLMGYPVGRDKDGKVVSKIADEAILRDPLVKFIDSYDGDLSEKEKRKRVIDESTEDQLRSLGYIQ